MILQLFAISYFIIFAIAQDTLPVNGIVVSVNRQTQKAVIRDPQNDYEIDLNQISPELLKSLTDSSYKAEPHHFTLPVKTFKTLPVPMGVRSDCTELPFSLDKLESIALDPKVTNQMDFLKSIPEGTMGTFTLMEKSQSGQKDLVSDEWPRVIRSNATGTLIMTYVCNPQSKDFNTIEVMSFDSKTSKSNLIHIDLANKAKDATSKNSLSGTYHHDRITENPQSCMVCHDPEYGKGTSLDPKGNWESYNQWPGAYGGFDDTPSDNAQYNRFKNFKKIQKDNPCYQLLPWAKEPFAKNYENYPYRDDRETGAFDYHLRPNLKLTDTQAHLLTKRLARKFKEKKEFKDIQYLLLMEAVGCEKGEWLDKKLSEILPAYRPWKSVKMNADDDIHAFDDPRAEDSGASRAAAAGLALGFKGRDWTLRTATHSNWYDYNPAMAGPNSSSEHEIRSNVDDSVAKVFQGELLRNAAADDPDFRPFMKLSRDVERVFGPKFSCIDDLGGEINLKKDEKRSLCKILKKKQRDLDKTTKYQRSILKTAHSKQNCADCSVIANRFDTKVELPLVALKSAMITSGKKIINTTCIVCHSAQGGMGSEYEFFSSEKALKTKLEADPAFAKEIDSRIHRTDSGKMPLGSNLTEDEKTSVSAYISSLLEAK